MATPGIQPGDEILVVDDTAASLQLLSKILTKAGHRVRLASDGELALRTVLAKPPALVLLDIRMPHMDGYEVCRRLKANEQSRTIPVIFISVADEEQDKVMGFAAGAVDYINKPFHPEEVLARVNTHLSLRQAQMALEVRNVELEAARNSLEERVRARSAELLSTNQELEGEIREHRRTLMQLGESEQRYRSMADTANEGIWMVDNAGHTVFVNQRMADMLGVDRKALSERDVEDFIFPEDLPDFRAKLQACRSGAASHKERRMRRVDGAVVWVLVSSGPVYSASGAYSGCFGMFADITALKAAEENQRGASRRKDEFMAMLGHELRNPLASIRNAGCILQAAGSSDERVRRVQQLLDRQVGQLVRMVDDLLDTTRLAKGKIVLRRQVIDWSELVRNSVEDSRESALAKGVELTASLQGPVWVSGDLVRLNQVASNLLGNGINFTGPGGHVVVRVQAEGGDGILTVRDDGVGMSEATLSQLFQPFVRGDEDRDNRQGGLGMGLALAKSLVDLHGGTITGTSGGRGQGSTFAVQLALAPAPSASVADTTPAPESSRAGLRVLVVEDNVDAAESLRDLLELMGYTVVLAPDGSAGLCQLEATHPGVVLCDIGLPGGMNGYDVARAVRANRHFDDVYLVAVSGYGSSEDKRRAQQAGFNLHMTKPVDPAALNRTLAQIGA